MTADGPATTAEAGAHAFLIVDAFAHRALEGNPCAVVLDAGGLDDATMQALARETNLSETAFVVRTSPGGDAFTARYFTPEKEIPFAGHPTLATVRALLDTDRVRVDQGDTTVRLSLPAGDVDVDVSGEGRELRLTMTQRAPEWGRTYDPSVVAEVFGLAPEQLSDRPPVQTVSTGTPMLMVRVRDHGALARARMDFDAYRELRAGGDFFSPHLYCLPGLSRDTATYARHFGLPPDTLEDPFTGSATGAMAAHLWRHEVLDEPRFVAEQGHGMGRPGRARAEVVGAPSSIRAVRVGGRAVTVVQGTLTLGSGAPAGTARERWQGEGRRGAKALARASETRPSTEDEDTDREAVERVRRFHRTVGRRLGALNDRFMSRDRPLGEARVLWEIGPGDGTTVRSLRNRLDLDAGYMSRLVRSLEEDGMATVEPHPDDGRIRVARLTDDGLEERALLDRRSDDLARSFLSPLDESRQARLVQAMGVVERLLTAGLVEFDVADPTSADARHCLDAYFDELDRRFEDGFDPDRSISADADELTEPDGLLLLARLHGEPVGCGALKFHGDEPAELKRMWVDPSARGLGLGRRLLAELEEQAGEKGVSTVRLETNRSLSEAIDLYRSAGYEEVEPFNDEPYAHHWFEKRLDHDPGGDP